MPQILARNLTLLRDGANVRITVAYTVRFSGFERNLAGLGMRFTDDIAVIGVDPDGATTGTVLNEFGPQVILVPLGSAPISLPVTRQFIMTRLQLDEDPSFVGGPDFNPDEIRCRIRIRSTGLPPPVTADEFTEQEVLKGVSTPVITAAAASASD
jgi:hypothetical protein